MPSPEGKRVCRVKDDPRTNYKLLRYNTPCVFDRSVTYDATSVPLFWSFQIVENIMKDNVCENDNA